MMHGNTFVANGQKSHYREYSLGPEAKNNVADERVQVADERNSDCQCWLKIGQNKVILWLLASVSAGRRKKI